MTRVILITLVLLAMASTAFAYRLIAIPTAETLPDGVYKLEVAAPFSESVPAGSPTFEKWLPTYRFDGTVMNGFEISVKGGGAPSDNLNPTEWRAGNTQVNIGWTIARETKGTPGYGIGLLNWYDSEDHVSNKESLYAGIFKTVPVGLKLPAKVHLLFGTETVDGVFGGFALPLSKRFSVAAEFCPEPEPGAKSLMTPGNTDEHLIWALGYNHNQHWRFKYANIGGDHALGVVYTSKWLQK